MYSACRNRCRCPSSCFCLQSPHLLTDVSALACMLSTHLFTKKMIFQPPTSHITEKGKSQQSTLHYRVYVMTINIRKYRLYRMSENSAIQYWVHPCSYRSTNSIKTANSSVVNHFHKEGNNIQLIIHNNPGSHW